MNIFCKSLNDKTNEIRRRIMGKKFRKYKYQKKECACTPYLIKVRFVVIEVCSYKEFKEL